MFFFHIYYIVIIVYIFKDENSLFLSCNGYNYNITIILALKK